MAKRINFWEREVEVRGGARKLAEEIQANTIMFDGIGRKHEREEFVFEINVNHFRNVVPHDERWRGFAPPGTMVLIDGKPKSRKSTLAAMMIAAHLSKKGKYENIRCNLNPMKHILYFDTESLKKEFENRFSAVLRWAGLTKKPDNLHVYNCAGMGNDPELKISLILQEIEAFNRMNANKYGVIADDDKIGLIVVDVYSDLVNDVNKKVESMDILGLFISIAMTTDAVIILIMHQNKSNNQTNGILGGDSAKKVSAHIKTSKKGSYGDDKKEDDDDEDGDENEPTKVRMEDTRGSDKKFKIFYFNYDEEGDPKIIDHFNGI